MKMIPVDLWMNFDGWLDENYDLLDKEFVEIYGKDGSSKDFGQFAASKHNEYCESLKK